MISWRLLRAAEGSDDAIAAVRSRRRARSWRPRRLAACFLRRSSDRLSQLAEDLLVLARLDKGTLRIRRDNIELDELLDGLTLRFERRVRESGRTIESDGGGGRARVDRLRIEQALGNLIDNAIRHGAGAIHVSASQHGDWLELHVTDEGAGFPADFAPHAFERFSRANQNRSSGGTGLGLAIVAAIAQAHGGTATAANAPGGGADVSILVPNPSEEHDFVRAEARVPAR